MTFAQQRVPVRWNLDLDDSVQQGPVVVPDQLEGLAVASEHVVLLLHRTNEVGLGKIETLRMEKIENF